jgi:ABC-type nickel/cobalt efflux system permease component RcnA
LTPTKDGQLSHDELDAYLEKLTPGYLGNLALAADNQPIALRAVSKKISLPAGAGGLQTLRVEWDFIGDLTGTVERVRFENKNNSERLGWNEIVVQPAAGIGIFNSTAFGNALTDELKTYPENLLNAPLAERNAEFSVTTNSIGANERPLQNRDGNITAAAPPRDRLAALISVPEMTPGIMLFGLLLAFGLGAMHAMSPGHGKTVVGAYLVGSKGTPKHAVFLGLTVTITHTLGVFALGLITLFASNYILPERILPFLNFVSGLLVFFIGVTLFKDRLFGAMGWKPISPHHHGHEHDSDEEHAHSNDGEHSHDGFTHSHGGVTHSHLPPENVTWRNLLALGISGGLLPCPSALVLMLGAISLGRIGYGIILTLAFSLGLAATLTAIGFAFLYLGKIFDNPSLANNRIVKTLPVFSAFVIACIGAVICYNSLA